MGVARRGTWVWVRLGLVGLLVITIIADHRGWLLVPAGDDITRYHDRAARVTRVIDGDTIEIDLPDPVRDSPTTRIRLWGIDTPELARDERPAQPFAQQAADFASALLLNKTVRVLLEHHSTRDRYQRLLGHIELDDGGDLASILLEQGLARTDDRWSHTRLSRFAASETRARRAQLGVWAQ